MKFAINNYDITLTVKSSEKAKANKSDFLAMLYDLNYGLYAGRDWYKENGYNATAQHYSDIAHALSHFLDEIDP